MRFQLLGLVGAWVDGTRIDVRGSKMRTFLASMVLARGRVVSDTQLMRMLWDENLPATTQAQIQTYASRLRSLLGAEAVIKRQPPGYRLELLVRDRVQVDLIEFENLTARGCAALAAGRHEEASKLLREALSRWHGQALGGVTDHLAAMEQPRLEEARLTALEKCIDAELALGEHQSLITELTALLAEEPLRERPHMQLMIALHRSGRTADALTVYQNFHTTLAELMGLDPSPEMRELRQSVLTCVPAPRPRTRLELPAPRPEPADPAPAPGPALPPEPSDFVGRVAEADRARAVLTGSPGQGDLPTVCAISGLDGTGKTTLALRVARLLRIRFPDRQLLVDLGGRHPEPPSAAAVLETLLGRLGVASSALPESLPGRTELYRRVLSGTRTLLVLDDAADERQVRPLLPGIPGCGVLITSRSHLATLEGTARISLDVFAPEESAEFLGRIIGGERIAAEHRTAAQIAELCGHLPVALRACGARLAARPHWSLTRLADRLADPRHVLDELRAGDLDVRKCLSPAFDTLTEDLQDALLHLSDLGPGRFTADTAAVLLGVPAAEALDVLDELVAAHLLRPEAPPAGHYRLPELVHALAIGRDSLSLAG